MYLYLQISLFESENFVWYQNQQILPTPLCARQADASCLLPNTINNTSDSAASRLIAEHIQNDLLNWTYMLEVEINGDIIVKFVAVLNTGIFCQFWTLYCLVKINTGWYWIDPVGLTLCLSEMESLLDIFSWYCLTIHRPDEPPVCNHVRVEYWAIDTTCIELNPVTTIHICWNSYG